MASFGCVCVRCASTNRYDISGSAHFINKADNGIVIHRSRDTSNPELMRAAQIFVRKVRNKAAGHIGDCTLYYDRKSGRYLDEDAGDSDDEEEQ